VQAAARAAAEKVAAAPGTLNNPIGSGHVEQPEGGASF